MPSHSWRIAARDGRTRSPFLPHFVPLEKPRFDVQKLLKFAPAGRCNHRTICKDVKVSFRLLFWINAIIQYISHCYLCLILSPSLSRTQNSCILFTSFVQWTMLFFFHVLITRVQLFLDEIKCFPLLRQFAKFAWLLVGVFNDWIISWYFFFTQLKWVEVKSVDFYKLSLVVIKMKLVIIL